MKKYFNICFLFFFFSVQAQTNSFKVDCGNDTVFCVGLNSDTSCHIGTQLKITNGIAPYKYTWSCKPMQMSSKLTFTASNFLSDTTLANPYIKDIPVHNRPWEFFLTVKDNMDNIYTDSLKILNSIFVYWSKIFEYNIPLGDSLQFFNEVFIAGGIPPVNYYWTPTNYLTDSTKLDTWCSPKESTAYFQYIIDSAGCKSLPTKGYNVNILKTSITENSNQFSNQLNLCQIGRFLTFKNPYNQLVTLSFYSISGIKKLEAKTTNSFFDLTGIFKASNVSICIVIIGGTKGTIKLLSVESRF